MPYCRIRGNCFYASFVARAVSLTFGKRLRAALDRKGLTAGHIAAIGEISRTAVYDYLNDKRNPEPPQCRIIAAVLGLPETEVLFWAGHVSHPGNEPPPPPPSIEMHPDLQVKLKLFTPEEQRRWVLPMLDLALTLREDSATYDEPPPDTPEPPPPQPPPSRRPPSR